MCCPGCRAVAQLITANGMESFYRQRTAFNLRPDLPYESSGRHYDVYNDTRVAAAFTERLAVDAAQSCLLIAGITCAACTWLIEQTLEQVEGVEQATVNLSQSRLDVRYNPQRIALGDIFIRVEALGYRPSPFQTSSLRSQMAAEYTIALRQLAVAGLGMMQVGMFAIALHAGDIQGMEFKYQNLLRGVSLLVSSFVVFYSARPFFNSAWRHLKAGALVMDLPVSLAIGLAWLASLWATVTGSGQVYFDSLVMFTFFLLLGRFLERRIRQRDTLAFLDAETTLPPVVKVHRQGKWQTLPRTDVEAGDTLLIPAGESIAVDAVVVEGQSSIDESTFNGEHMPRTVSVDDAVYAGTLNLVSPLQAIASGSYVDSRLAALQHSVERALTEKPRLVKMADSVASVFIAGILLISALTALAWFMIDPSRALWITLSVLVVSCPCALALATPVALTAAANSLRTGGVILRGENAIEALSRADHLIFDKTGTLTLGKLRINSVVSLGAESEAEILRLGAALQVFSSHPIASAFSAHDSDLQIENVEYRVGSGLEGWHQGRLYRMGNRSFCAELAPGLRTDPGRDLYWIALCRKDQPLAWIGLSDKIREEAGQVVSDARQAGLYVELLTGDSSEHGSLVGASLGIHSVRSGVSPQQKMDYVRHLQSTGATVAMVGDGLNDAPVLAVAAASFAVAGASGLARAQADFILTSPGLEPIITTWRKARHCRRIIIQNLAWALGYNFVTIPLAVTGSIPPWAAAIGMSASSLLVILNSLRLNRRQ